MNKLNEIFSETFNIKKSVPFEKFSMRKLDEWDSLKHMELISNLEKKFKLVFKVEEIIKMVDYKSIKKILISKKIK